VLHLVNAYQRRHLTWPHRRTYLIPIGPLEVRVKLPEDAKGHAAQSLVSGARIAAGVKHGWAVFELKSILDHKVIVIS
jgi:hypothetical protein